MVSGAERKVFGATHSTTTQKPDGDLPIGQVP
jgi:hypothetical protein